MKLNTKLTLFNTISKLVIVVLFVLLLPFLIARINLNYTDDKLVKQKEKVLQKVSTEGIANFISNGESYGSYTLLKEEYVSLEEVAENLHLDTIQNERRVIEGDTIQYRILSYNFNTDNRVYLLEVGKSVDTLSDTSSALQNLAFQVLVGMILLTILADQFYTGYVLRPLRKIINTKLIGSRFPVLSSYQKIQTSTTDFQQLDLSIHQMMETITDKFQKEREFISNASHELMTPISILQSKIENMFDEENISDEVKDKLLEMQKTLNRLKSITKTLLLISQIENAQFIKNDTVNLYTLLQDVYDEISIKIEENNIQYSNTVNPDVTLVGVNKFLLFNLFFNLINNAIKYNKNGGAITIQQETYDNEIKINIIDTGIGIDVEELPHIFNRFKKLKQSLVKDSFGLGLPIVKSIANYHNIKIEAASVKSIGSTFTLTIPKTMLLTDIKKHKKFT